MTRHQFPIYAEEAAYMKSVGTAAGPAKGGPLTDIIHGLGLDGAGTTRSDGHRRRDEIPFGTSTASATPTSTGNRHPC